MSEEAQVRLKHADLECVYSIALFTVQNEIHFSNFQGLIEDGEEDYSLDEFVETIHLNLG